MSNNQHVRKLRRGAASWNKWLRRQDANFCADLRGADLQGLGLKGANLAGADLVDANLTQTDLKAAQLRTADLSGAKLMGARLREADLRDTNLRGARLDNADLTGVRLRGSVLHDASLFGTELGGAMLEGADLDNVLADATTRWPKGYLSQSDNGQLEAEPATPLLSSEQLVADDESKPFFPNEPIVDLAVADPQTAPPAVSGVGRRVDDLSAPGRKADAMAASDEVIALLWEIQLSNRLSDLEDAELRSQIAILEALSQDPSGPNLVIVERAIAAATKIVVRNMPNRDTGIRTILDLATSLGAEDPTADGETINAVLQNGMVALKGFKRIEAFTDWPYLPRPLASSLGNGLLSVNVDSADFSTRLAVHIVALMAAIWQPAD